MLFSTSPRAIQRIGKRHTVDCDHPSEQTLLVTLGQATTSSYPRKRPLNNPAPKQDMKPLAI